MELETIEAEYQRLAPQYDRLKEEVSHVLRRELDARRIPVHLIEGRVKTLDSLVDKATRQDVEQPFEFITDICGVRVICLFRSDLSKIGEAIEGAFEVESKDDKIAGSAYREFGYLSVHYVGKLPQYYRSRHYIDIKDLRFELQVRTIAMHAWDSISHHLDYKAEHAVPSELRRDFYALSALLYLADSQFETLVQARQQVRQRVEQQALEPTGIVGEEINLDTMSEYLRRKFPHRKHSNTRFVSNLIEELDSVGYSTIAQVDSDVDRAQDAFARYERRRPPVQMGAAIGERTYPDVTSVRISLLIANPDYAEHRRHVRNEDHDYYAEFRQYLKERTLWGNTTW